MRNLLWMSVLIGVSQGTIAAPLVKPSERFAITVDVFVDGVMMGSERALTRPNHLSRVSTDLKNGYKAEMNLTASSFSNGEIQDRILMNLVVAAQNQSGAAKILSQPTIIVAPGLPTQVIAGNLPSGQTLQLKVRAVKR